jgi:hypothetical protein
MVLLLFFPCHVLKSSNATLSGRAAFENVSRKLKNFLLLLLSNNATEGGLVEFEVIIMPVLNFIEHFLCLCKAYTQDHYTFTMQGLRKILPKAIKSVSIATINQYCHCCHIRWMFLWSHMDLQSLKTMWCIRVIVRSLIGKSGSGLG